MQGALRTGGPAQNCLSRICYDVLVKGVRNVDASIDEIPDYDLRLSLEKLTNKASTLQETVQIISDEKLDTIFDMAGLVQLIRSPSDILNIVQKTVNWYVLGRAQPGYDSFKEGLSSLGVLDSILKHPSVMREAFCFTPETVSAFHFDAMFTVTRECEGSHRREEENRVLSHWKDFLQDCEEQSCEISLPNILFFATGCKDLPPHGRHCELAFLHEPEEKNRQISKCPKACTCTCTLYLPVVHNVRPI